MTDIAPGAESDISAAESVRSVDRRRVCRYKPGYWLQSRLDLNLLNDNSNYPAEVRQDIIATIVNLWSSPSSSDAKHVVGECMCSSCMMAALAQAFGFNLGAEPRGAETSETEDPEQVIVPPSELLPRFFWYKHELIHAFGDAAIVAEESAAQNLESDEEDIVEVEDEPEENSADVNMNSQPPPSTSVVLDDGGGVDITEEVVKSKKKSRIAVVRQSLDEAANPLFSAEACPPTADAGRVDSYSAALQDLQFRLNKHGFLADPRTYLGKGRGEEMYDKNDSLFDENEALPVLESEDSSFSEQESNVDATDDFGYAYAQCEHLFVMDDLSEEEEEQIEYAVTGLKHRAEVAPRSIVVCQYPKPVSLMRCIYNPRGWRVPLRKLSSDENLPMMLNIFFSTLEYVISHKRTQTLQRRVYDTYEFVRVSPTDPKSLTLSDFGRTKLSEVVSLIFEVALECFLVSYNPSAKSSVPKFLRFVRNTVDKAVNKGETAKAATRTSVAATEATRKMTDATVTEATGTVTEATGNVTEATGSITEVNATGAIGTATEATEEVAAKRSPPSEVEFVPVPLQMTHVLQEMSTRFISPLLPTSKDFYKRIWLSVVEHVMQCAWHCEDQWTQMLLERLEALKEETPPGAAVEETFSSIVGQKDKWAPVLQHSATHQYFSSIEQLKICARSMSNDDCPSEWVALIHDQLLLMLKESERKKVEDEVAGEEIVTLAIALSRIPTVTFAQSTFVYAFASWWTTIAMGDDEMQAVVQRLWQVTTTKTILEDLLNSANFVFPSNLIAKSTSIKFQTSLLDKVSESTKDTATQEHKRKREDEPVDAGSEKKKRMRILVSDILQTHFVRIISLLQASPLRLPLPFAIAIQATVSSGTSTSHAMIVMLHNFESCSNVDIEVQDIDPPLPQEAITELLSNFGCDSVKTLPHVKVLSDFLDKVHACKTVKVEGRSRSLVFAGFDTWTKSFSLLSFPIELNSNSSQGYKRDEFMSSEASSVKGRLSLLDFLSLHLWLQTYSKLQPTAQQIILPLVFSNNPTQHQAGSVSPALSRAVLNGGDIQQEWKNIIDRNSFAQLKFLKKWVVHLSKVMPNVSSSFTSFDVVVKSWPC